MLNFVLKFTFSFNQFQIQNLDWKEKTNSRPVTYYFPLRYLNRMCIQSVHTGYVNKPGINTFMGLPGWRIWVVM